MDITAGELCLILGKKFFVRRDDSFQLYLQKNGFGIDLFFLLGSAWLFYYYLS
jgi:hypothetical protein